MFKRGGISTAKEYEMGSDLGIAGKRKVSSRWHLMSVRSARFLAIGVFLTCGVLLFRNGSDNTFSAASFLKGSSDCVVSFGSYAGPEYSTTDTVGKPKCLVESKFMKVQQHHVRMPSGSDNVISDWLWVDYHDRINVLVQAPQRKGKGMEFYVFDQSKYALEMRTSLAIVGGIIEPGERPEEAARREVLEEMKVECKNLKKLGRFRTDVNRGVGWTNSFVALDCRPGELFQERDPKEEVGIPDTEHQSLRRISLKELRDEAAKGSFLEIQWTATVSTALLQPELQNAG